MQIINRFLLLIVLNHLLLFIGMFLEGGAALVRAVTYSVAAVTSSCYNPLYLGVILSFYLILG